MFDTDTLYTPHRAPKSDGHFSIDFVNGIVTYLSASALTKPPGAYTRVAGLVDGHALWHVHAALVARALWCALRCGHARCRRAPVHCCIRGNTEYDAPNGECPGNGFRVPRFADCRIYRRHLQGHFVVGTERMRRQIPQSTMKPMKPMQPMKSHATGHPSDAGCIVFVEGRKGTPQV